MRVGYPFSLSTVALFVALTSVPAKADLIVDPFGLGDTAVSGQTGNGQLRVGFNGNAGALELNANSTGNGTTLGNYSSVSIGNADETSRLRVVGNGEFGSARLFSGDFRLADAGDATLQVLNGGIVQGSEIVVLGQEVTCCSTNGPVTALTEIDGPGSRLSSVQLAESEGGNDERGGRIQVGFDGQVDSTVNITNGGTLVSSSWQRGDGTDDGSILIGSSTDEGSSTRVNIDGPGSRLIADGFVSVGASTEVNNNTEVVVTNGGLLQVLSATGDPDGGLLVIDNAQGNASVSVSGVTPSEVMSPDQFSQLVADQISLGNVGQLAGFTSDGTPVSSSRTDFDNLVAGQQATDVDGNLLFDQTGAPLLAFDVEVSPGFTITRAFVPIKATGDLTVEGAAIVWANGDINISRSSLVGPQPFDIPFDNTINTIDPSQTSNFTVRNGASVLATNIFVNEDGVLQGGDGNIVADVTVNGGTIAPGNSPGQMNITGNLSLNDGLLELEYDRFGVSDLLLVDGDVFFASDFMVNITLTELFDGTLDFDSFFDLSSGSLSFESGFSALSNISFDIVNGSAVNSLFNFRFEDQLFEFNNGSLAIAGQNNDPIDVPEPAGLMLLGLGAMTWMRRRKS